MSVNLFPAYAFMALLPLLTPLCYGIFKTASLLVKKTKQNKKPMSVGFFPKC